jgi:metallo-beta-lactamase class B
MNKKNMGNCLIIRVLVLLTSLLHAQTNPAWTTPVAPFHIAGNLYYVGSQDLASCLIVTPEGNILINSSLTESVPMIRSSVDRLGFKFNDIKVLLISHSHFPPAKVDRILHDGDTVTLGGTVLVAHKTAGHTRGCTTWTLQEKEGGRPLNVVIVGSWNVNSGWRLVDRPSQPASYPKIAADYRRTFALLEALPCDIFLGAHGAYFGMLAKLDRI